MREKYEKLYDFLCVHHIHFKKNFTLKYETYFKSGGKSSFYILPSNEHEIRALIPYLQEQEIPFKVLGLTTNVFLLDEFDYGVIISTRNMTAVKVDEEILEIGAGYSLQDMVRVALIHGKGGVSGLEGIPGTVGGAIVMNAGAYGYAISDHLTGVCCLMKDGSLAHLSHDECKFKFRSSIFKEEKLITVISATFKLPDESRDVISAEIEKYHIARHSYQEFSYPNLGSMFSVKGDFYSELFHTNYFYYYICIAAKLIFKNPVTKFIMRKRPNNEVFNRIAKKYILNGASSYTPSVKSMNILVNTGDCAFDDMIKYMGDVRGKLQKDTPLENEFILFPVESSADKVQQVLTKIKEAGLI